MRSAAPGLDPTITQHLSVESVVARLYAWYAVGGNQIVLTALIQRAERVDQPLRHVWARACWTPHELDYLPCCQTFACPEHREDHDAECREFFAQLREETL